MTVPRCANTKNNSSYLSGRRTVEIWRETLRVAVGKRKPKESQRLQTGVVQAIISPAFPQN